MTPLEITMLLHIGTRADPIENIQFPAQKETITAFENLYLIRRSDKYGCGFELTPRGEWLKDILCSVPLPTSIQLM